jgi:CubicO group peptidase (beta-lactamase class C family)
MKNTNTPGLSIAIIWDRKPVWIESFGSTDKTGKQKVTNETIFSIQARERSLEQHAGQIAQTALIHPVGEQFEYSNRGFDLAGYILQKVSGEPFGQRLEFIQ